MRCACNDPAIRYLWGMPAEEVGRHHECDVQHEFDRV